MPLHETVLQKDVTIVPGCGVVPGLSNMLVGYSASKLEKSRIVKIMIGGLPQKPKPFRLSATLPTLYNFISFLNYTTKVF